MDFKKYKIEFTTKAKENGYSAEIIQRCLNYAEPLLENSLPVIYNSSHFAGLVGYELNYLNRAIVFTYFFYRDFEIKKKNGKPRNISEPLPSLKEIQTWILQNILYKIEPSKYAKAYIPGLSLKQNLVFHKGQEIVLTLDIRNFFSSIRKQQVENLFRHLGYSLSIADLLSKLCCKNECLPQGAPTSAYISNLIMKKFDECIYQYCLKNNIRFTRYADDLCFSGDFDTSQLIGFVKIELKKLSLKLNDGKTKLMRKYNRQIVTGVVVNEKMQVVRTKRKKLRQTIYFIKKFTLQNHKQNQNLILGNYISHLLGQVQFILFINPNDAEFNGYKEFLIGLKNGAGENPIN